MDEPLPRRVRIVLCMGEYCNMGRRADAIFRVLNPLVNEHNRDLPRSARVRFETARCLSMCGKGPNCVVYPDDRAYSRLDPESALEIAREYLGVKE
jgi:(2Fe-2S) ferredoxin